MHLLLIAPLLMLESTTAMPDNIERGECRSMREKSVKMQNSVTDTEVPIVDLSR